MINFVSGDFFDFDASIRVNTVNCVGVMGAGVALAFKKKYPDMYNDYVRTCKAGGFKPGQPQVWRNSDIFGNEIEIINFPTKNHWRRPSKYEYIEDGLVWLSNFLSTRPNSTVTLPALGCGHGGLDWHIVKNLILDHLVDTPANVLVFEPFSSINAGNIKPKQPEIGHLPIKEAISVINSNSSHYPSKLKPYTHNDLYIFGDTPNNINFDISIISSTKPDTEEKNTLKAILNYCKDRNLSVLFGASSIDKNLATQYTITGLRAGVFLPSGIFSSAQKLQKSTIRNLILLSIGSPTEEFNRKDYLPAVISRSLLGTTTIFTTKKLEWISKHKKKFETAHKHMFFMNYDDLNKDDIQAAINSNLSPIETNLINFPLIE